MFEANVSKGIKSRLKGSALTFDEKLKLSRRVLKTEALKIHHRIILHWIFKSLEKKKNSSIDKNEKSRMCLWSLLEYVSSLEEELSNMGGISAETFINIITPTENPEISEHMWDFVSTCFNSEYLLLILSKDTLIFSKVISVLIDQFSDKIPLKKNFDTLLQKLPTQKERNNGDVDGMIISLSQGLSHSQQLKTFLCHTFFPQKYLEDWSMFLSLLFEVKDEKPPVSIFQSLEILKDPRIQLEIFLPRLFSGANAKMSSGDVAKLFIFFSYLLGFSHLDLILQESVWMISSNKNTNFKKTRKKKCIFLLKMVKELSAKEDKGWKCLISSDVTFLKWTQHLAKELILEVEEYAEVLIELIRLNPVIIEPLIGNLSCSLLFHPSKDFSTEFSFVIDIYSKLRLIPKLIAKTLIYLSQHTEIAVSPEFSFNDKPIIWNKLIDEFQSLVFGQCLELWKSLDYHLNEGKANSSVIVDVVMDLFLSNCRLVDFSIPDSVIEKVSDMINKTSRHIEQLHRSRKSLVDFALLLKNVRGVQSLDLLEEDLSLNSIQRIKWNEVNSIPTENLSLENGSFQMEDCPLLTPHLDSKDLRIIAQKCTIQSEKSSLHSIIEEDKRLQVSIVELLEERIVKSLSWKRTKGEGAVIEELNSAKRKGNFKLAVGDVTKCLQSYLQLPLEHLEGPLSNQILIFCFEILISKGIYSVELLEIVSRSLFTSKSFIAFKTLDISQIVINLTPIPRDPYWKRNAVKLLISYTTKGFVQLSKIETHLEKFVSFFEPSGINELETGVLLLSELNRKVSSITDTSNKSHILCKKLFDSLSQSLFKRVANLSSEEEDFILLILEGVTVVLEANCRDTEVLSPWKDHVGQLFLFCTDYSGVFGDIISNFLKSLCSSFKIFNKTIDVSSIWNKLKLKRNFSPSEELLIEALFQIPKRTAVQELLSDIMLMSKKNASLEDFCATIGLWQILVKTKNVPSEIHSIRQEYIEALLNFYHSLVISDKLSSEALLKVLELEKAIFYCEKAVIKADSQASCLITSLRVELKTPQENEKFFDLWNSVYEIVYLILQRRSHIVVPRIPIILEIVRNLVKALMKGADQVDEPSLGKLSLCTRRFERLLETFGRLKDDFKRVAPYLVADILIGFQCFKIHSEIKSNLISALHWLFKLFDKHSSAFLASSLPLGLTDLFKDLYDDYTKNYKFSGRI